MALERAVVCWRRRWRGSCPCREWWAGDCSGDEPAEKGTCWERRWRCPDSGAATAMCAPGDGKEEAEEEAETEAEANVAEPPGAGVAEAGVEAADSPAPSVAMAAADEAAAETPSDDDDDEAKSSPPMGLWWWWWWLSASIWASALGDSVS